jgi:hypothetical protein
MYLYVLSKEATHGSCMILILSPLATDSDSVPKQAEDSLTSSGIQEYL